MNTHLDWTKVGEEFTKDHHEKYETIFNGLQWKKAVNGTSEAMMPAMGINEAVKQLRIPKVSHYVISRECAPCGLYGIRGHYKNTDVDVFIIDTGCELMPIAMNVTVKE